MDNKRNYTKEDAYQILNMINEWTRSSDTKTSILLAFISLLLGFTLTVFNGITYIKELEIVNFLAVVIVFFLILYVVSAVIAVVCCCISLTARLKLKNFQTSSIFYFGDIANCTKEVYISKTSEISEADMLKDLKEQIEINSRITKRKFQWFNYGLIASIILFFCAILLLLMVYLVM